MQRSLSLLFLLSITLLSSCSSGTIQPLNYKESSQGDLSSEHLAPSALTFAQGENIIAGTTQSGDRDYFWFTVPANTLLSKVILSKYVSADAIAFAAIQKGQVITEDPSNADAAKLLGWLHMGAAHVNKNILTLMGGEASAIGFTPPLGPGDYAFWVQQTGATTDYELKFTLE